MYKIVRMFFSGRKTRVIKRNLTLEQAQEWCKRADTSSRTVTTAAGRRYTARYGHWFDGYQEQ